MRKFLVLFVLFLYVIPSIGFTFSAHYCGGELSGISFGKAHPNSCPCGIHMTRKSCCEDRVFSLKLTDTQQKVSPLAVKSSAVHLLPAISGCSYYVIAAPLTDTPAAAFPEDPPCFLKQPLYLLHEVFRI